MNNKSSSYSTMVAVFVISIVCAISLFGCKKNNVQVPQSEIIAIQLVTDTAKLKADGQFLLTFHAQVTPGKVAVDAAKNVTFNVTPGYGTIIGSTNGNSYLVTADNQGNASVTVKVGSKTGVFMVSAQVTYNNIVYKSADVPIILNALSFSDKLSLTADNLTPVADGASLINLHVASYFETDSLITLTTNDGTFVKSGTPATYVLVLDAKGQGTTSFKTSVNAQPYMITATFKDGTTSSVTINPQISYPDLLLVEPTALQADSNGTPLVINSYLRKTDPLKLPSASQRVSFEAYQLIAGLKTPVGRFTGTAAALSDATGKISAVSFYGDTGDIKTTQPVYIAVSAHASSSTQITQTIQIKIKH